MYDPIQPNTQAEMEDCFVKQVPELRQWWERLPASLKIDTAEPPTVAPPSHIVTLKYVCFSIPPASLENSGFSDLI